MRDGEPSIALALGGGGARGLAHVHVIDALDELGIRPKVIAGSSIGSIMGAGMAAGMTGREIAEYSLSILGRRAEIATRMWRARPPSIGELVTGGFRLGQFNVERILGSFLPDALPQTFEGLQIPLKVTATDFYGHKLAVFSDGPLLSALAASAALPAAFRPVRRDGMLLIDGGIYNPVPFDLIEGEADIIVAIDVVGAPESSTRVRPNGMDLLFGASQLMMQSIIAMKLERRRPDVFLRPPVSKYRVLDFLKVEQVLAETAPFKDEVKRAIDAVMTEWPNPAR